MRYFPIAFLLILFAVPISAQDDKKPTAKEVAAIAARDFEFQGEYKGTIGESNDALGMQVIAIGNGKFKVVAFPGGLPGDGWNGEVHEAIDVVGKYNVQNNSVDFVGYKKGDAFIKDGTMTIKTPASDNYGSLVRVVRESETLGAEAPDDATVLFDGSSVEGWKNGKMTDAGLLKQGTTSKKTFHDHSLHIEFQLPFKPTAKGQGRGNSGIYVQGRYEVQMLDSFGLEGKNNECGGIYSVKDPDLNMCYPPMSWQTYDIDFIAAKFDEAGKMTSAPRMTVQHNGVVVHDDVELPARKTTAAPLNPGPEGGPIYLQDHGNPVRFRNIWVVEK